LFELLLRVPLSFSAPFTRVFLPFVELLVSLMPRRVVFYAPSSTSAVILERTPYSHAACFTVFFRYFSFFLLFLLRYSVESFSSYLTFYLFLPSFTALLVRLPLFYERSSLRSIMSVTLVPPFCSGPQTSIL